MRGDPRRQRWWKGVLCALTLGCGGHAVWTPRNVVIVTVDTLRADHLGCYGYPRPTSPFIDWMAAQGVLFEHAFTSTATTVPAHASIFSGLYPSQHRVRRNGQRLATSVALLSEAFARRGYQTAAFVSTNGHFAAGGLDRGFSTFDEPGEGRITGKLERPAHLTVALAARWLHERGPTPPPLFLWIHLFDPHSPYEPEEPLWQSAEGRAALATFLIREHRLGTTFFGGSEKLMVDLLSAYDGEVHAVDTALRGFYGEVGATLGADTLWILTADHGEGLGNHDWLLHGKKIYNEQLRIPLIFHAPGRLAPARIGAIVQHVDLYPTLLALIGDEDDARNPALLGRSLVPLLFGSDERRSPGYAFSERRSFAEPRRAAKSPAPAGPGPLTIHALLKHALADNYEPGERYSIQNERFKLIWNTELGSELYDLEKDPYETTDLSRSRPEVVQELHAALERKLEILHRTALTSEPEEVSPEARRALKALGYVDP